MHERTKNLSSDNHPAFLIRMLWPAWPDNSPVSVLAVLPLSDANQGIHQDQIHVLTQ
jgi:hypothetical protein